jgi:DNA-binding transcriptional LysR family regulator
VDLLGSMKVFIQIVDRGSLSAAAAASGISPTMAGNHLRALEQRMGMKLMNRTTRRQNLTAFGQDYYRRCQEILRLIDDADSQAQELRDTPSGLLRVTAPATFGNEALIPALADYLAQYPALRVDLVLSDRVTDLVAEGFEAAIRIGHLPDSGLIAKPLAPYRLLLCASPSYLARRGTPRHPDDLASHECLSFNHVAFEEWRMQNHESGIRVPGTARIQLNNGQGLRVAALHGLGITLQPAVLLERDVEEGRLVRLFPDYPLPVRQMSVVYLPDRYRSPRLRSFVDFVVARFGDDVIGPL